ncbi:MAG TPA: PQQ-binding-like beta-propeller repeat protein [Bryobacteraceae bacterium]|nr:PQQ-binding-like beta-propeller repeat protein [Bryobacteraceae bacterium]
MLLILILLLLTRQVAVGEDWPQFLGPERNGSYSGPLAATWPKSGPAVLWEVDVGHGFSAPVVARGRVILFHRRENQAIVESLEAGTGKRLWSSAYTTDYRDDFGFDEGPRGAPAVAGERIYTFGADGVLQALDFSTGKRVWSVDTRQKFGAPKGFFGAACSPLVDDGRVLMNIGGPNGAGIGAFDAATGKVLWTATSDEAGYSAPVVATIAGVRHALFWTRAGLVDADPATGKVRFQFPWRSRSHASVNAAAPVVVGNLVFLSASYGTGATLLQIDGASVKQLWASDEALSNHYATSVYRDGYVYGYHGRQEFGQSLRAIELKTGKVQWNIDGFGAGTVTLAGDRLLLIRENGELIVAAVSPKEFRPIAQTQLLPAVVRSYPALADGRLYVRNERTLACFKMK